MNISICICRTTVIPLLGIVHTVDEHLKCSHNVFVKILYSYYINNFE